MSNARSPVPSKLREHVYRRDMRTCVYCGCPVAPDGFHLDHVKPVALGGLTNKTNLVTACPDCNQRKGDTYGALSMEGRRHLAAAYPADCVVCGRQLNGEDAPVIRLSHPDRCAEHL